MGFSSIFDLILFFNSSIILFCAGFTSFLYNFYRSWLVVLLNLELGFTGLILLSIGITLITLDPKGYIYALFIFIISTAEVCIGLSIGLIHYRICGTATNIDDFNKDNLKGFKNLNTSYLLLLFFTIPGDYCNVNDESNEHFMHSFFYEIVLFLASSFILILGLFFYNFSSYASSSSATASAVNYGFLYTITETFFIFFLIYLVVGDFNILDYCQAIFKDDIFWSLILYKTYFNGAFFLHYSIFYIKNFFIFLFLFLNFLYRWCYHFNYNSSDNLRNSLLNSSYISPLEVPYLILSATLLTFMALNSGDYFILIFSLEGLSFIGVVFLGYNLTKDGANSSLKYFLTCALSSGLVLLGIIFTYLLMLDINFLMISDFLQNEIYNLHIDVYAFSCFCILIGFFLKLSVFPGNFWILDVYKGANLPTIYFFIIVKSIYFLLVSRLFYSLFFFFLPYFESVLHISSIISLIFCAYGLCFESNLRRFIAYSSVGHFGLLLLALSSEFTIALATSIFCYLVYYNTAMLIFFFCIMQSAITLNDSITIDNVRFDNEKFSVHPFPTILVITLFSLAGLPPFLGFFAKFQFLLFISKNISIFFMLLVTLLSSISAYGYLRFIKSILYSFNFEKKTKIVDYLAQLSMTFYDLKYMRTSDNYLYKMHYVYLKNNTFFFNVSYSFYFIIIIFLFFFHLLGFFTYYILADYIITLDLWSFFLI